MFDKIDEVLNAQAKIIEPLINNGTLFNIRDKAEKEFNIIYNLRQKLYTNKDNEVKFNNIIVENLKLIIDAFSSVYSKLGEESRTLPTENLRKCAIDEMNAVMSVWSKLPSNKK